MSDDFLLKNGDKILKTIDLSKAKKVTKSQGKKVDHSTSPYTNVKNEYRDSFARSKTAYIFFAIISVVCLLISLVAVGGMIATAGKSKYVPYVVAVDNHGMALVSGIAEPIQKTDEKLVVAFLSEFITALRTVSVDVQFIRKNIFSVTAHINHTDLAFNKAVSYMRDGEKGKGGAFARAATEIVNVKIVSVLAQTPNTYQVDWVETTRGRDGKKLNPDKAMRALITWYRGDLKEKLDEVILNPLGLYVSDYSITELQ